jgi:hypothetical protein
LNQGCDQADDNGEGSSFDRLTSSTLGGGPDAIPEESRARFPLPTSRSRDDLLGSFKARLIDVASQRNGLIHKRMSLALDGPSILPKWTGTEEEQFKALNHDFYHFMDLLHSEQESHEVSKGRLPKRHLEYHDLDEDEVRLVKRRC